MMSHVKPQHGAIERSSTVVYAEDNVGRQEASRVKNADGAAGTKEFHKRRLAANDAVRRFQGSYIGDENEKQICITMTGLERCVIQEMFQCVRPSTGVAFAPKDYLRDTIGCDAKVVASAIAKATRLGWLRGEGRDRYRPNFERAVDAKAKLSAPESDAEDGKYPDWHGESPRQNGENPALYKDSNTVTTTLSDFPVAEGDSSERDSDRIEAELSFSEIWQATGKSGKEGPARAAWGRLTNLEKQEVSTAIVERKRIELGDVWLSVWLNTKAWRDFKPGVAETAVSAPSAAASAAAPDIHTREAWSEIRADLIQDRGSDAKRYLGGAELHARVRDQIILTVTGSYLKERLDSSYREMLSQAFSSRLGVEINVVFQLREPTNDDR